MKFEIDEMKPSDWEQVASIYLEGIQTGIATFQTEIPDWLSWDSNHINVCRLVLRSGNDILGWAALSPFSKRPVYCGVADTSIYIGQKYRGLGLGEILLNGLILESEKNGFWTLRARITKENVASIALHKKCGFREVGIEEKIGKMANGVWHDVMITERRSKVVGVD